MKVTDENYDEYLEIKNCKYQVTFPIINIDAFDVIVHIFKPEVRDFYNLEKMWQSVANLRH